MKSTLDIVLAYHRRTKHNFQRYAAGPGELDWKNQPDPFRHFAGSPQLELPLLPDAPTPRYANLYTPALIPAQPIALNHIASLLELAFGITAWKQYENTRWALRSNPSSGNLHPTEAYVVATSISGINDGVHHYLSRDHVLEQRCRFDTGQLTTDFFLIGLSSIHWREAWKYGERAFRYCQHDVGHAIAAVRYAAATLGWQARMLPGWSDADIGTLLGLDRDQDFGEAEREQADVMLMVNTPRLNLTEDAFAASALVRAARNGHWQGRANKLSPYHPIEWPVIDEVAQACIKPQTQERVWPVPPLPAPVESTCERSAIEIIRQRRSAQALDDSTSLPAEVFYRILDMTLPRPGVPPWDVIAWQPRIHLALFVHRVADLRPGLYLFLRNPYIEMQLRTELSTEFEWVRAENCPAHFSLFRLVAGDAQNAARALSCRQDIAADGAFSLGMLAEYETGLAQTPWVYRHLFWEAGILGQALYLEAEAAGVRGTGIGCYFDDAVHDVLGIKDQKLQSLYHFTIGAALTDERLQTLPGYAHLNRLEVK